MIKLLLTDVDGVMTDGGVTFSHSTCEDPSGAANGWLETESKTFSIRDGLGIRLWQRAGGEFGIVTGRQSEIVARRAAELDVTILHQGIGDKLPVVEQIAKQQGLTLDEVAYVGDDLPDLPVIRQVGMGVAVADAAEEVIAGADCTLNTRGGHGAVRELVERILKKENRWDAVIAGY